MEKKFDIENFEKFLREVSDDFRIYPSKSVWGSIYNNVHPGKKWPSISVSLLLFATLIILGYLNTENNSFVKKSSSNYISKNVKPVSGKILAADQININEKENPASNKGFGTKSNSLPADRHDLYVSNLRYDTKQNINGTFNLKGFNRKDGTIHNNEVQHNTEPVVVEEKNPVGQAKKSGIKEAKRTANYDNQLAKKSTNRFSWQIYAAPAFANNSFADNINGDASQSTDVQSTQNVYNITGNKPSLGLEVGATMQYNFLKNLKITTGLQLNYSRYYLETSNYNLAETGNTNSAVSGNTPEKYFTDNNFYSTSLSKEMYQLSIPVGVIYKIAGKDQLYWNVGASIQPTLLMGESNQSNDLIKNASAGSKWNLNAGFETFISYKISGITWQLGPQFRYQLISSFNRQNSFVENPYVYGLKLGISKPIK